MKNLRIADDLKLPRDVVTSTLVVYGGKGMGKTNLGSVLMEELAAADLKFAVLDPMGVWWGLRYSEDGKGPGIKALILGGVHGDIPIEPTGGAVVADLVVDEEVSVVIDISRRPDGTMWSIGERIRFVTSYCQRLYQRQGERRRPIMQVIDEAARFIPQTVRKGEEYVAACMGAIAVLVEEGRNVAIGVTLITQRSARLNKDVAELADVMIAFRTVGPNSRAAVLDWLGEHVEKERLRDLDQKIRSLPIGAGLVVSPGWLEFEGVVRFRARQTFDSSATPKPGETARKVRGAGATPDLAKYQSRMVETIERAKENDPKELKKQNADLKRQLAAKPATTSVVDQRSVDRAVREAVRDREAHIRELSRRLVRIPSLAQQIIATANIVGLDATVSAVVHEAASSRGVAQSVRASDAGAVPPRQHAKVAGSSPATPPPRDGDRSVGKGAIRQLLIALAQHPEGLNYRKLGVFSGVSTKGGSFRTYLSTLRGNGWIVGDDKTLVKITDEGVAALGTYEPLPVGRDLLDYWITYFGNGKPAHILRAIGAAWPDALTDADISERADVSTAGGSYRTYLSTLRSRDLIVDVGRGQRKLNDDLAE